MGNDKRPVGRSKSGRKPYQTVRLYKVKKVIKSATRGKTVVKDK